MIVPAREWHLRHRARKQRALGRLTPRRVAPLPPCGCARPAARHLTSADRPIFDTPDGNPQEFREMWPGPNLAPWRGDVIPVGTTNQEPAAVSVLRIDRDRGDASHDGGDHLPVPALLRVLSQEGRRCGRDGRHAVSAAVRVPSRHATTVRRSASLTRDLRRCQPARPSCAA